jgi:hypothetical protein
MRPTPTSRLRLATTATSFTAAAALLAGGALLTAAPASADKPQSGHCARQAKVRVPGAEQQKVSCLDDLTTAGTTKTGHTNPGDWAGLHAPGTTNPTGIPGLQVDGYFPDTSTTNTNNGWKHDSQFVLRIPDDWNGGLVVSGAPGVRAQYANDLIFSDWALGKGFAFASTDKGNTGAAFYRDGSTPGGSIREWNSRVTELTLASKRVLTQVKAKAPRRTYMAGISNGGYLTRWQLENHPDLWFL